MSKRVSFRVGVLALIALAITACQLATLPSGTVVTGVGDTSLGPFAELPDDQIEDVARGGSFAFETYVSVDLDIDIELVSAAELTGAQLAETEIIATVTNPDDEVLMDCDVDLIPDIYDAYPNDPTIGFETTFAGDGAEAFTVAFEDNFPNLGGGDYNGPSQSRRLRPRVRPDVQNPGVRRHASDQTQRRFCAGAYRNKADTDPAHG